MSPRDYNGHGTHTASTAGGNYNTPTTGPASGLRQHQRHGPTRPHRRLQGLYGPPKTASTASGYTSDLVAAIDQAVADGVDVINYSISGTRTNFLDPVQVPSSSPLTPASSSPPRPATAAPEPPLSPIPAPG
jgi:subtilisin family serine protease